MNGTGNTNISVNQARPLAYGGGQERGLRPGTLPVALNMNPLPLCERRGAAVDFIVDDESMLEVAQWIVANTPFDRLYFYGDREPVHVSFGPKIKKKSSLASLGAKRGGCRAGSGRRPQSAARG